MKIQFDYIDIYENPLLAVKTDDGVQIRIWFEGGAAGMVELDEYEIEAGDDTIKGLYVAIKGRIHKLYDVLAYANGVFDDIEQEHMDELAWAADHAREISSPYWTGRA